jgi:hypothetical protein
MADQILPKGIRLFNKHQNAPEFVIGTMVITPNDLVAWLKEQPELMTEYNGAKQIRLQILKSKDGNLYCSVDTYKKDATAAAGTTMAQAATELPGTGDLPF